MTKSGNVKIFAWDGSEFREIVMDTTGHLQVDALSVANPPNLDKAISKLIDKSIVINTSTRTGSLAAGASEAVLFAPPAGKMWRFIFARFDVAAPPGAGSGTHTFTIRSPRGTYSVIIGASTYTGRLRFDASHFRDADSIKLPPDEANLGIALSRLVWDNSNPAKFQYFNSTNVAQTNTREYELDVLEEYCS